MIWFFLVLLLVTATLILFRGEGRTAQGLDPVAHHKAQLRELDADLSRGAIDETSAKAARVEIERRILRAAHTKPKVTLTRGSVTALVPLGIVLVVIPVAFYAVAGRPGLPAKPGVVAEGRHAQIEEGGPTYEDALTSIRKHLAENPDDAQGWDVLAKSARAIRDYSTAANAFDRLAELQPNEIKWRVHQFEAMLAMAGGRITPAARLVLARVLNENPNHPAAQYYLGLAYEQMGDADKARVTWTTLADRSAPNAPWMGAVRQKLAGLGVKSPELSDDQMAAVAAMSDEDRAAFIDSMIARLAGRLEDNPDDPEGWMMLARSQLSLGNRDAAIAALERGISLMDVSKSAPLKALLDNLKANPDL
ncbi:c-type cytochrome biogenesis protein CcmI [Kordiimonas aestuarii]|uniref:c-type cytochrome biogenesis protein CcmI n=1 Tax=Kordiimonas aestuarii TaxID=1005925 RepID=UPI0021CF2FC5|nr:c-type cytochrome biogenesis protein CcmI [Kordiimonas aestuarii]